MDNTTMAFDATCTSPSYGGRKGRVMARRALVGALASAILTWVPLAHAVDTVGRTPLVRPQALQTAPAGYRQLMIPAAYVSALTAQSRTVEFRLTYRGKPATLAVTVTETGRLVNAFVSGALPTGAFTPRRGTRYGGGFWDVLRDRINACKEKYPGNSESERKKREACIDDAIVQTTGEWITGGSYEE